MEETVTKKINADTSEFDAALEKASQSTKQFGRIFTSTIKSASISGKGFDDTLRTIGMRISNMALNKALAPIEGIISNVAGSFLSGTGGAKPFAKGGAFNAAGASLVSSPTYFSAGGGLGVMGEAGPEAIVPLSKGADGRLGIAGGGAKSSVNVIFNVSAPDPATFAKSEGQITAMLARAVRRGETSL